MLGFALAMNNGGGFDCATCPKLAEEDLLDQIILRIKYILELERAEARDRGPDSGSI